MSVSVLSSNLVAISTKKRGDVSVTITAYDDVNGYEVSKVITYKVLDQTDLIDVVSGDIDIVQTGNGKVNIISEPLSSFSIRINQSYSSYFNLSARNPSSGVSYSTSNGVLTVTNTEADQATTNLSCTISSKSIAFIFLTMAVKFQS